MKNLKLKEHYGQKQLEKMAKDKPEEFAKLLRTGWLKINGGIGVG